MSPKDLLSALIVILAWGVNFVVIKVGLHGVPPMLLGALRFTLVAFPAVFFVKRPAIPLSMAVRLWRDHLAGGQFVLSFLRNVRWHARWPCVAGVAGAGVFHADLRGHDSG